MKKADNLSTRQVPGDLPKHPDGESQGQASECSRQRRRPRDNGLQRVVLIRPPVTCGQARCEGPSRMGGGVLPGRKPSAPGDRCKARHKVQFSAPSFLLFSQLEREKLAERRARAPI